MPSERSMPSEITGEKAERTKAKSISLQTWIRPFWMTVSVTGSRLDMAAMTSTAPASLRYDRTPISHPIQSRMPMNAPFAADKLDSMKFGIGQPVPRQEDPTLLQGQGRYTDD